jgi:WhiB family redox-sensing transcriptional regulator
MDYEEDRRVNQDESWRDSAACLDVDPYIFFPTHGGKSGMAARHVCAGCPVRTECLNYALEANTGRADWGIWGGTGRVERLLLRRATT